MCNVHVPNVHVPNVHVHMSICVHLHVHKCACAMCLRDAKVALDGEEGEPVRAVGVGVVRGEVGDLNADAHICSSHAHMHTRTYARVHMGRAW